MSVASTQLKSLIRREVLRYVRRPYNTFLPPLITNVLYFSVFGVILGSRIGAIGDVTYIQFVLPGLVVLGAISNAFENSSFSIFHGRWNEYIHEVVTAPLSHSYTVAGYVISSALRGLIIGALIIGVGFLFTSIPFAHPLYLIGFGLVTTTLFAGLGVIGGLFAEDFDHLTVMNQFLLRPLVFFGGVFYSLEQLDGLAYTVSLLNPMVYMVNGVRYGMLGVTEIDPNVSLLVLTAATVVVLGIDLLLFKRGVGISD
ncbi:ABC transporter permease [Halopiger djelfimassiliensis]|uniref:ABC transporter permease n=1 Tax=Halopiger djelfimassiliensis TaxID=1293047 RepID=UPI000677F722|nr:ABC transporter permease [Halopiger djelfimassiliensis]